MKSLIFLVAAVLVLTGCRTTKAILIHKAAFDGKIKEVRRHLDGGVDANEDTHPNGALTSSYLTNNGPMRHHLW